MRKKILKICIIILAVWLCMGIIDYTLVAVMEKEPMFCIVDEDYNYFGIGYEFEIYSHEYIFYIFGQIADSTLTNGG